MTNERVVSDGKKGWPVSRPFLLNASG